MWGYMLFVCPVYGQPSFKAEKLKKMLLINSFWNDYWFTNCTPSGAYAGSLSRPSDWFQLGLAQYRQIVIDWWWSAVRAVSLSYGLIRATQIGNDRGCCYEWRPCLSQLAFWLIMKGCCCCFKSLWMLEVKIPSPGMMLGVLVGSPFVVVMGGGVNKRIQWQEPLSESQQTY